LASFIAVLTLPFMHIHAGWLLLDQFTAAAAGPQRHFS